MTEFRHGLMIGKFYPPRIGHHDAIRAAVARCDQFTVVVMAAAVETIPLADRMAWLHEEHQRDANVRIAGIPCDAPVDVTDQRVWAAQVAAMRAGRTGSSTAVRRDLAGHRHELAGATRAGLVTRVVVVGAESTGTTTVAQQLARHYAEQGGAWAATQCVPEYGREYTELKCAANPDVNIAELQWNAHDFDVIAPKKTRLEELAARAGSPILICDTGAFATAIWKRRYLVDASGGSWTNVPPRAVYLLTDHEGVPWHDDGMWEGDLAIRAAMTGWFSEALTAAGHSWVRLTSTLEERIDIAVRTIEPLLEVRARFGEPLRGPGFEGMS